MQQLLWEGDTPRGHYQVIDTLYDGRKSRVLYSGDRQAAQSGIPKDDNPRLLFDYNQRMFEIVTALKPRAMLVVGGGVFTLPTALLHELPALHIDAVEPDEGLTELAERFFDLPDDDRLRIYNTDGRSFLREHPDRYDLIFIDAYMHTTIPRELKTRQAFAAYHAHLKSGGLLTMNVISGYEGQHARVLKEVCAAAKLSFDSVDLYLAGSGYSLWLPQNFVLTAQSGTYIPLEAYTHGEPKGLPEGYNQAVIEDD